MFRLEVIAGRGRGLVAARGISRGEVVLREEAYVFVISDAFTEVVCAACGDMVGDSAYKLGDGDTARFCSVECISSQYALKLLEMRLREGIAGLEIEGSKESLRLIAQTAILKQNEGTIDSRYDHPALGRENTFAHLLSLEASEHSSKDMPTFMQISKVLSTLLLERGVSLSAAEALHLLLAIQCNAHRIVTDTDGQLPVALGLFPTTSMMNHSCDPNCAHEFKITKGGRPMLLMRAMVDVEANTELTYSYTKLYQATSERQSQLMSAYGFSCACSRCVSSQRDSCIGVAGSGGSLAKEVFTCLSLANRDYITRMAMYSRLLSTMSSSRLEEIHPLSQTCFYTYTFIAKTALHSFRNDKLGEEVLLSTLAYGLLSVACSFYFVRHIMADNVELICAAAEASGRLSELQPSMLDAVIKSNDALTALILGLLSSILFKHYRHDDVVVAIELLSAYVFNRVCQQDAPFTLRVILQRLAHREIAVYHIEEEGLTPRFKEKLNILEKKTSVISDDVS